MVKYPTDKIQDDNIRFPIEGLQEDKLDNLVVLSAAPTADTPLLQTNEFGFYDGKLYIRVNSTTIYEITPSDAITIT